MKYLILAALFAVSAVSSRGLLRDEMLDDLDFMNQVGYNLYNGFVRGLYREHTHKVVDEKCFGEWIKSDMTHVDDVVTRLFTL